MKKHLKGNIEFDDEPKRWKYRLTSEFWFYRLPNDFAGIVIEHEMFFIWNWKLNVHKGYAWDGASGPTIDDNSNYRASLVHDVLYQCIREGFLDKSFRPIADRVFYDILREDGMPRWRAMYYYAAVRLLGWMFVRP